MNSDFRDKLSTPQQWLRSPLGMVILIACIVSGIGMVAMTDMDRLFVRRIYLGAHELKACLIIIGIRLIKMIANYTIDSVVDVMLLAIARQMIVEHTSPIENLIAVLSIGILFVIGSICIFRVWTAAAAEGDRGGHPRRGSRRWKTVANPKKSRNRPEIGSLI